MAGSGAMQFSKRTIVDNWRGAPTQMPTPYLAEDFLGFGATLADYPNVLINQSGTELTAAAISATAGAPEAGHGGWVAGKTDDVDAEIDEIALGQLPWLVPSAAGNGVVIAEAGFVIPTALTARQYFFGLTDDETEGTGTNGSLNIQTGTTVVDVATDAVGFILSSLATDADGYYMAETTNGTQALIGNSGLTAVVDRYTILRVEVDVAGNAYLYGIVGAAADNRSTLQGRVGAVGSSTTSVTPTVRLIPLFTAAPTTTTGVEWEIDYLFGAQSV